MPVGVFGRRIEGEVDQGFGDGEWVVLGPTLDVVNNVESQHTEDRVR